jgi:chromosome partitioning protein
MLMITVAHLKGGSGKTTSAAYLAHALADTGKRVVAFDCDPQGTLHRWAQLGKWEIPVPHVKQPDVKRAIGGMDLSRFDVGVIDTAPYGNRGSMAGAMELADIIVLPMAPTLAEIDRVKDTYKAAAEAGAEDRVRILLNRTIWNAASLWQARRTMTAAGRVVLKAQIPRREDIGWAMGGPVSSARGYSGYTGVALELLR